MSDYYALTYTDLRLAELRTDAARARLVGTSRLPRVRRGRAAARLVAAIARLGAAPPARSPAPCCA